MNKLFLKHKDWLRIVKSFGCRNEIAEDIVQEMYLKLGRMIEKGLDISYNDDDINYWYVYQTLKSIFLNIKKKEQRVTKVSLDECIELECNNEVKFKEAESVMQDVLNDFHWYDKKVWLLQEEMNLSELSRRTGIKYRSLYNTKVNVEKVLRKRINEIK